MNESVRAALGSRFEIGASDYHQRLAKARYEQADTSFYMFCHFDIHTSYISERCNAKARDGSK